MLKQMAVFGVLGLILTAASTVRAEEAGDDTSVLGSERLVQKSPWEAQFGFVYLQRNAPSHAALMTNSGGTTSLDANQYGFDFEAGPDLTLLHRGEVADIEFRWFQDHDWISSMGATNYAAGTHVMFETPLTIGGTMTLTSRMVSQLDSFELNAKREISPWLTALAGIRYIEFDDSLYMAGIGGQNGFGRIRGLNDLLGAQVGLDTALWNRGGRFSLSAGGKMGVFANFARGDAEVVAGASNGWDDASTTHTAFMSELNLTARYQISTHWSTRLGYQLLWVDGVAEAGSQMAHLSPFAPGSAVMADSTLFCHGMTGGLECRW